MLNFRTWLEADESQQQRQKIRYYREILGLPFGFFRSEDPYRLLQEAYRRIGKSPQADEAYRLLWQELDRTRGGRHFDQFFSDVSSGAEKYKTEVPFQSEYDMADHAEFEAARDQYHGYFDRHIKTSIPTFGEIQVKKGHAIVRAFGNQPMRLLDIAGSEGSWARSITHLTNGNIKTDVVDPNQQMHDFYQSKGQTPGSNYIKAAFIQGWMEDDGTVIPALNSDNTPHLYDIVHESMGFQFFGPQREFHVREAKKMMNPGGLFLTEEKLRTDPKTWKENEEFKDQHHKSRYYSSEKLAQKEKVVAFGAEKKKSSEKQTPWPQDDEEAEVVGMANNMVSVSDFEKILKRHFKSVWQYWDSGNFKGYAASDAPEMVRRFLSALGSTQSRFSRVQLPREVSVTGEAFMPKRFSEWLLDADDDTKKGVRKIIIAVLPADVDDMTDADIRDQLGDAILAAVRDAGHDVGDDNLEDLLDLIDDDWAGDFDPDKDWDSLC